MKLIILILLSIGVVKGLEIMEEEHLVKETKLTFYDGQFFKLHCNM